MSRATQERKHRRDSYFAYGAITLWGAASQQLPLYEPFVTSAIQVWRLRLTTPRIETRGLGYLPFRSPLLGESRELCSLQTNIMLEENTTRSCFMFLSVLRCFTSRGALLKTLLNRYVHTYVGFPIRRPPDQRLQTASPEHFAG